MQGPAMTEDELAKFIKTLYYSYDRALVPKEIKEYVLAWSPYVQEFPYLIAQQILPNVCIGREYPPRPWEIRVAIMNYTQNITPPPTPQEAWAYYQQVMTAVANGTTADFQLHPVVVDLLVGLRSTGLNNQFDAKRFEDLYKEKVNQWMKKTYWMGTTQ